VTATATLLPDPEPRDIKRLLISTDDHIVEPANLFVGRLPAKFEDKTPRIITQEGVQAWLLEDLVLPNMGLNAVAGRPRDQWYDEPRTFDEIRPGCYDIHQRIRDMDLNGVYASLNFPSRIAGFAGARFSECKDKEFGLACTRAWNDWHFEEWYSPYPNRIIPLQVPWLADPDVGAEEIRRNAERGFRAVTFPEIPLNLGLPSIHTPYWDPIMRACEETQTVICLHVGSSGLFLGNDPAAARNVRVSLFSAFALVAACDWLWSGIPVRFPNIQVAFSEGGIGWLPGLIDRLNYMEEHSGMTKAPGQTTEDWMDSDNSPSEVLLRNFKFCVLSDPMTLRVRDQIGVENITFEVDYPHADSTWPDSQAFIEQQLAGIPEDDANKMCYENAARIFRHPLPATVRPALA
jgi:predicted TIM-barrel fold metal-dependent hydrolase